MDYVQRAAGSRAEQCKCSGLVVTANCSCRPKGRDSNSICWPSQGEFTATARHDGRFASRSFTTPHLRTGYELIEDGELPGPCAAHCLAGGRKGEGADRPAWQSYDLVLDPEHLSLTMHESCGHPSELDRALGLRSQLCRHQLSHDRKNAAPSGTALRT